MVDNTVIIKRVSDDAEITPASCRLAGDIEAFAFAFSADIALSDFDLIKPLDGPVELEVTINGQAFLVLVEEWGEQRSWGQAREDTITVQGRSVSAELDEPYKLPKSRDESETRNAFQLMSQELPEGTDWTLVADPDWTDYSVPGGTFSYSGLTPIRAIALVAAASGAVILPDPASRTLHIVPRFGGARPWRIDEAASDVEIDYGLVNDDRGQWLANRDTTPREGIYIEGEKNGVATSCRLDGTAGNWAEPVVEVLCTDPQAGLQRGITELGQSWIAAEIGLQIPLSNEAEAPGFVGPAQIALVTETVSSQWKGLTTSWDLTASWNETDGLIVWQQIGIERYIEWTGA